MEQPMKVGLSLSGGGAIGAYEVGVVRALAESGTDIHAVAGASIGALNGAILASSNTLAQAAERMAEIWSHLGRSKVLAMNKSVYLSLLAQFGFYCGTPILSNAGSIIFSAMRRAALATGVSSLQNDSLFSDQPLIDLMNRYMDMDALSSGLPLYVSLYPTEGGMKDILNCVAAEFGLGATNDSEFIHVQSLPAEQRKQALLASAALPLLFKSREINGVHYSDGGMGGWSSMQGNTPVKPLVDAGCNMIIVTHLCDGSAWDRHDFSDTIVLEIRPQQTLKRNNGIFGGAKDLLGFSSTHISSWIEQGYQDTLSAIKRIQQPLQARQALRISEGAVLGSQANSCQADKELRNAMDRLKKA
ncbi:MAG: patatin-like phospholipase family protein [Plesiomonas shigelloides]